MTSPFPLRLALSCLITCAGPRRIYTTPRSASLYIDHRVHSPGTYLCPRCTSLVRPYLCTSLYLDLYLSAQYLASVRVVHWYKVSLPGWWFLTLTSPPRCCPPTPPSSCWVYFCLSCLTTSPSSHFHLLAHTHFFCFSSLVSLLYFFPNPGTSTAVSNVSESVPHASPHNPLLSLLTLRINSPSTHYPRPRRPQPVRCLSHMGFPMPAAVPHHRTLHCIACIVSRLALVRQWITCSR